MKWLRAADRSANDRYIIRSISIPDIPLSEITADLIDQHISHLSNSTYNRYRAIIVAIFNLSGVKIRVPTKQAKNSRMRFLTKEEWDKLYAELPQHLKPLAQFSILTGLRQRNVTHLRWDQIDIAGRKMWVHPDEAKAGKPIGIPLADEAIAVLTGQFGLSDEWVFPYKGRGRKKNGEPMEKIKTAWRSALTRAGLTDFTWHGLRHTWASWHLMAGTPIETLAKLGGWEDLRMVQKHYGHLASEHLAQFAGNARPWSRAQPQKQPQQPGNQRPA